MKSNFYLRTVSTISLLCLILILFLIDGKYSFLGTVYSLLTLILLIFSIKEYQRCINYKYLYIYILPIFLSLFIFDQFNSYSIVSSIKAYLLYFLLIVHIFILDFLVFNKKSLEVLKDKVINLLPLILLVLPGFLSMYFILQQTTGFKLLVYVILIVASADIFAYIFGKKFGSKQISPMISPKKTIEGSISGLIFGILAGFLFKDLFYFSDSLFLIFFISLFISISSQIGDILLSCIKRINNKKDFGNLIPGHGGILDRMDGLLFSLNSFYLIIILIMK